MITLKIKRHTFTEKETIGKLFVDGVFFSDTLEDKDRKLENGGVKVPAETAIPRGEYEVTVDWSNRFQKYMIHVLNVPGFEGVRIHGGRDIGSSAGCPLVGKILPDNTLAESRIYSEKLFNLVDAAIKKGQKVKLIVC